ncbi:LLM class flavin-dependent oxidoreductase [Parahaliea mediterranea]|uniref:LLM class flavin-dependent oxidoreductase n=1 Tax=Parahaliea mediterranea TaxID=651086 RepID=A0A939IJC5_9GAMM|nr:LLM class flavin-dependent oxidoreductase [Parahaliea mediterranea]MBN7797504.1 LLM class flavin-dependent oxidoreductase [Parahaliea mediterranea]
MDIGIQQQFSSFGWQDISDSEVYAQEMEMTVLAEELGYDTTWALEHHFTNYSFCPDNLAFLCWAAARTERIKLGTGAVILPWNDPLRVTEKACMLDELSGGRLKFGMGRGLSRREFDHFTGIELGESRERFDEASQMIIKALECGFIEGEGPFYPQKRVEIRPRPRTSFKDRTYAVANSEDSVKAAAAAGAAMIMFAEKAWEKRLPTIEYHRELYQELYGSTPRPIVVGDFTFCHEDADCAKEVAEKALTTYLSCILHHYELAGTHLADAAGYSAYAKAAEILRTDEGLSKYVEGYLKSVSYGTPEQIINTLRERRDIIGDFDLSTSFRFGGLEFDDAKASMKLFAEKVMPELRTW